VPQTQSTATLADLTLRLSQDLSALETTCRREQSEIDAALHTALENLPAAKPLLTAYTAAASTAGAIRDRAIAEADGVLRQAQDDARSKRRDALLDDQQQYLDADRAADDRKQAAVRKAASDYQSVLDRIDRTVPLDRQAAERRSAYEAYQRDLLAADEDWKEALGRNREKQQQDLSAALERERRLVDQAADRHAAAVSAAADICQQTVDRAQSTLTAGLRALPEAAAVLEAVDRRRQVARADCHAREEALFAAFHDAIKSLA